MSMQYVGYPQNCPFDAVVQPAQLPVCLYARYFRHVLPRGIGIRHRSCRIFGKVFYHRIGL